MSAEAFVWLLFLVGLLFALVVVDLMRIGAERFTNYMRGKKWI